MAQIRHISYLHWEACERARIFQPDPSLDAPFQLGFRPGSAIYCGDFNCSPASAEYQELLRAGRRHRAAAGRRLAPRPT